MKRKSKKALIPCLKIGLATVALGGIICNVFLLLKIPDLIIVVCAALIAISYLLTFYRVQKWIANDHRVDRGYFIVRAVNWGLIAFYWLFRMRDNIVIQLLLLLVLFGLVFTILLMIKHSKSCRIKFAEKMYFNDKMGFLPSKDVLKNQWSGSEETKFAATVEVLEENGIEADGYWGCIWCSEEYNPDDAYYLSLLSGYSSWNDKDDTDSYGRVAVAFSD